MKNSLTSKDCSELRKLIHYDNLKLNQESVRIEDESDKALDKIYRGMKLKDIVAKYPIEELDIYKEYVDYIRQAL